MSDHLLIVRKSDLRELLAEAASSPYYTQDNSPLGRERHCDLVRSGVIRGWKHGRTWFARRVDVDAWIETPEEQKPQTGPDELPPELQGRIARAGGMNA